MNKIFNKIIKIPTVLWFSIIMSTFLFLINVFRWSLIEIFTPFFEPLLELFIFICFIIVLIWSLIFSVLRIKTKKIRSFIPLCINIFTIIIVFSIPFDALNLKKDFYFNKSAREEVVKKITNKELEPNISYNKNLINLPTEYTHLSKGGGDVIVKYDENQEPNIFFFTFRGILDNFSGFTYYSGDNEPQKYDFNCDYVELEKLENHWFWMACS